MIIPQILLSGNSQKFCQHGLIEAYDKVFAVHDDDRHAELAAFLHHFPPLIDIRANVIVRVLHAVSLEKFLGHVTEVARRG
mgnify:CR=1